MISAGTRACLDVAIRTAMGSSWARSADTYCLTQPPRDRATTPTNSLGRHATLRILKLLLFDPRAVDARAVPDCPEKSTQARPRAVVIISLPRQLGRLAPH